MNKWFIYVTDHHEGPFTVEEIQKGISEGKFPASGFVWAQGMSDWLPMSAVPEFNEAPSPPATAAAPPVYEATGSRSQQVEISGLDGATMSAEEARARGGMTDEIAAVPISSVAEPESVAVNESTPAGSSATVERTAPVEPTRTAAPVEPTRTAAPVEPTRTAAPVEPTRTAAPVEPTRTAAPVEPTRTAVPVEPERTLTTVVEVNRNVGEKIGAAPVIEHVPGRHIELEPQGLAGNAARVGKFNDPASFTAVEQKKGGLMKPLLIVGIIAAGLFGLSKTGVLRPFEDKVRGALVSLPELPDLSQEERAELEAAAKTPLSSGPSVALAVSRADPISPSFYVASNLPDGTRFEIYLEGLGHTMLNTLEFSGKTEVALNKHIGKSSGYRAPDGRVVPRGEYRIFVVEAPSGQPDQTVLELAKLSKMSRTLPASVPGDRRIMFEKQVFLGQKDASYTERLAKFHDQLKQKAQSEVMELKQSIALIENQLSTTQATFERLKKQKLGPPQLNAWKQMDSNWTRLDGQLSEALSKVTPDTIKTDYVYGAVYGLLRDTQKKLREIHSFHGMFFDQKTSLAETEDQISKIVPDYERLLGQLRAAVAAIESSPTDEHGLPKKLNVTATSGESS